MPSLFFNPSVEVQGDPLELQINTIGKHATYDKYLSGHTATLETAALNYFWQPPQPSLHAGGRFIRLSRAEMVVIAHFYTTEGTGLGEKAGLGCVNSLPGSAWL